MSTTADHKDIKKRIHNQAWPRVAWFWLVLEGNVANWSLAAPGE